MTIPNDSILFIVQLCTRRKSGLLHRRRQHHGEMPWNWRRTSRVDSAAIRSPDRDKQEGDGRDPSPPSGPRSPDRQFWVGKMPTSATQKLRTRKGCWFGWAWPPPVLPIMLGAKVPAPPPVPQMFTSETGFVDAFASAGMWPDGLKP